MLVNTLLPTCALHKRQRMPVKLNYSHTNSKRAHARKPGQTNIISATYTSSELGQTNGRRDGRADEQTLSSYIRGSLMCDVVDLSRDVRSIRSPVVDVGCVRLCKKTKLRSPIVYRNEGGLSGG